MLLKIGKIIAFASLLVFVGSLFVIGSLENSYLSYPRAPEPSSERTVPFHIKGIVVYITRSQRETLSILYYVHGISISLVACILILSRGRAITSKWPWQRDE